MRAKHGNNENSLAAWESVLPTLQRREREFIAALLTKPMTSKEVAVFLHRPLHTISGRPRKLARNGLVVATGIKRENSAEWMAVRNPAQVSMFTEVAQEGKSL